MDTSLIALIVVVVIIAFLMLRFRKQNNFVSEETGYGDLPEAIEVLKSGGSTDFVGFSTQGFDALYFVYDDGEYFLDYELFDEEMEEYEEAIRVFAEENGREILETSYDDEHTVLRIPVGSDEEDAVDFAFDLASSIFGHSEETHLDLLP